MDITKAASSRRIFFIAGTLICFYFCTYFLDSSTISHLPDLLKNPLLRPSKTITHWNRIFRFFYANPKSLDAVKSACFKCEKHAPEQQVR